MLWRILIFVWLAGWMVVALLFAPQVPVLQETTRVLYFHIPAAWIAVLIVQGGDANFRACFLLMLVATLIDATDGWLARAVDGLSRKGATAVHTSTRGDRPDRT